MNALLTRALLPVVLLASSLAAHAADPAQPTPQTECIALGGNRDIRPSSTEREGLLRNGEAH